MSFYDEALFCNLVVLRQRPPKPYFGGRCGTYANALRMDNVQEDGRFRMRATPQRCLDTLTYNFADA